MTPFPAPGTPEGDRWADAGYPVDQATGQPAVPPAPDPAPGVQFPAPGTPEGERWAAAGYPIDPATHLPVIPQPAAPGTSGVPQVGALFGYPCHDAYASGGARSRVQVILVTGTEENGARVRGVAVGYTDNAASFTVDQLIPLS